VFQLGLAAPAVLTGILNGVALRADRGQHAPIALATPVHAAQQVETFEPAKETSAQQVLLGLFGIRPALAEWIVGAYDARDRQDALARAQSLQRRYPGVEFKVFRPSAALDGWVVTIGGQMTQAAANRQIEEARAKRIPGVQLRRVPRGQS
jgi:hypothetical protein